jgi:hypothetical protein
LCVVVCWLSCFPWPFLTQASLSRLLRRRRCRLFAADAMFATLQFAVARLEVQVAGLRRQLELAQAESRGLQRAVLADAADDAGARRELQRQHRVALAAARETAKETAKAAVAEEMAAAVAAARVEAAAAERDRLRASVGPVLVAMQAEQGRLLEEAMVAKQRQEALEAELVFTRQLVFDALSDPAEVFARLGL